MAARLASKKPASDKKKIRKSSRAASKTKANAKTNAKTSTKARAKTPASRTKKVAPKRKPQKPEKKTTTKVAARAKTTKRRTAASRPAGRQAMATSPRPVVDDALERAPESSPQRRSSIERSPTPPHPGVPVASPSERVLATCAELPIERSLSDEERDAMAKVAETARRFVGADGAPPAIVARIAAFVDEVRSGRREEPKSQDVRLGLGVLWGEQVRAQVGWRWVHLTYPDGFASYALVPDDRAFACFPLNRLPEALRPSDTSNRSAPVFESIRQGTLPARKPNAYLVIG